jgi:hypothetical protein
MAETFKITLAGPSSTPVEGTEHLTTMEEINMWLNEHQVYYEEGHPEKPENGGSKYVVLPSDMN